MTRSHDGEMPVIDRCDFGQPEALGDGNNRRVDDAQRKIQISGYQFGHARDVVVFQSATAKPSPPNDLRKITSARGPTRDWSR